MEATGRWQLVSYDKQGNEETVGKPLDWATVYAQWHNKNAAFERRFSIRKFQG